MSYLERKPFPWRKIILTTIVFLILLVGSCSFHRIVVPPATEAVLVDSPYFLGSGGVQETPLVTGSAYAWASTKPIFIDMQSSIVSIKFDDLMTKDGVPLDFEATFRYKVASSVQFVKRFDLGKNWFARTLEQPFRNACRDSVKQRGMNEMAINAQASAEVDAEISNIIEKLVVSEKLPVIVIDVTLGKANPPDSIKHQRIDTATQEQRIQTENQRRLAEEQRIGAETARAKADNAYRQAMGLDPDNFIKLESIKAMEQVCGKGNCQIITTGALPTFGIK